MSADRSKQKTHSLRHPDYSLRVSSGAETACGRTVAGSMEISQTPTCRACAAVVNPAPVPRRVSPVCPTCLGSGERAHEHLGDPFACEDHDCPSFVDEPCNGCGGTGRRSA